VDPGRAPRGRNFGSNFLRRLTTPQLQQDSDTTINIMSDTEVAAPAQYRQPSRKGKKAWRKNVDVTQINDGLKEVREQIIQGHVSYSHILLSD
jgi:hypothetical protein